MDDPRFWLLREALASYASDPDDPPVGEGDRIQAAVSLVVRGGDELAVLLIKRARHEGDPWSGHMALPGGRRESSDPTLADTAVRETREETAVDLTRGARLGRLDRVAPQSAKLPHLTIHPFVFGVHADAEARVASREVDAVHWVSLAELQAPETSDTIRISLPEGSRDFPCMRVAGEVVWGLTYRILDDFLRIYPEEALRPRPPPGSRPTRR